MATGTPPAWQRTATMQLARRCSIRIAPGELHAAIAAHTGSVLLHSIALMWGAQDRML
jgi:hypothetical protein